MSINRLRISPTPSNTATITPSITPTITECPGICFSGTGTNNFGIVSAILQDRFDPQKVMIVGSFSTYNGITKRTMVRSYTDGEVDNTFDAGTGFAPSFVQSGITEVSQQTDGKYVCTGTYSSFRGVSRNHICRVNYDGTLDTSFVVGTGYTRQTLYSLIQSSGKILVCSVGANQYSGTNIGALSRLNTDGSLDTTFNNIDLLGTSTTLLSKIHENPDGTFYVCGNLVKSGRRGILKLNSDGSYASTDPFNTSGVGSDGSIADFQVQADGKLICVGDFNRYNGPICPRSIVRINPNGTRDNTFNPTNSGANNNIFEVELQGSKYVVCSFSSSYSGISTNQVFRINADGSYDFSFNDGNFTFAFGPEDTIQHSTILSGATNDAGYIFIGGLFTSYDGVLANNIVKMDKDGYIKDCDAVPITPTPTLTRTPTQTPSITSTPTNTPTNTITSTPTQTPCINCYEYSFTASTSGLLSWLDCDGIMTDTFVNSGDTYQITCIGAREGSVSGTGTIVQGNLCSSNCITPTPTQTSTSTPTFTPTNTITPSITSSPTQTPSITPSSTCPSFTTQYMEVILQSCHNFSLKLFDNPDLTGNANAVCDVIVSGCGYGDMGTVYCGTETIASGDHVHNFSLQPVLQPGECVSAFTVSTITEQCPCYEVIYVPTITPTPTMTPSNTPTFTPTNTNTPNITSTPTNTPTPTINCPATIYTHGAVRATCADFCTENYLIQTEDCASQSYAALTIGDFIYGYAGQSGYIAYSNISTDTNTGPFRIADIDGSGEILGIYVCSGGSCIPL